MSNGIHGARQMRRRLATYAVASLALHAVLLLLFQFAGRRDSAPPAEPVAIRIVELSQAPAALLTPEPPMPPEIPDPSPQEIPQQPDPQPERPPEPEIPDIPPPEPEIPDEPAEQPEIPASDPAPEPTPDTPPQGAEQDAQPGVQMTAPDDTPGAAAPGLVYDDGGEAPLARFGRAVECAGITGRHDTACADIGPIYLAGDAAPLAPNVPEQWLEEQALEAAREARLERIGKGAIPETCAPGDHDCFETIPRMRDNPLVRGALPVRQVLRGLGLED